MSKAVSGKGISAAVRASVHEWMTSETVDLMFAEHERGTLSGGINKMSRDQFRRRVRSEDDWVRVNRTKRYPSGFDRIYYSKQFSSRTVTNGVRMEVVTNAADTQITYVKIFVRNHLIGGGEVKVPSMLTSQYNRDALLTLKSTFRAFTNEELSRMQSEYENSGDIALFAEREV